MAKPCTGHQMRKVDGTWQRNVNGKWQSLKVIVTDPTKLSEAGARRATKSRPQTTMPRRINVWSWS